MKKILIRCLAVSAVAISSSAFAQTDITESKAAEVMAKEGTETITEATTKAAAADMSGDAATVSDTMTKVDDAATGTKVETEQMTETAVDTQTGSAAVVSETKVKTTDTAEVVVEEVKGKAADTMKKAAETTPEK